MFQSSTNPDDMRIYRCRIVLEILRFCTMPLFHQWIIYALLCEAWKQVRGISVLPDGIKIDTPENGRVTINPGQYYAFGITLFYCVHFFSDKENLWRPEAYLNEICQGLDGVGRLDYQDGVHFQGNFKLVRVEDLIANKPWNPEYRLKPIPFAKLIQQQTQTLLKHRKWTLRFLSPLRIERKNDKRVRGHGFMDEGFFSLQKLVQKIMPVSGNLLLCPYSKVVKYSCQEKKCLYLPTALLCDLKSDDGGHVLDNELVWVDCPYGSGKERTLIGGAMGRVRLEKSDSYTARLLAAGQYLRPGESSSAGYGKYIIEQLRPERFACDRAISLLDVFWSQENIKQYLIKTSPSVSVDDILLRRDSLAGDSYLSEYYSHFEYTDSNGNPIHFWLPGQADHVLMTLLTRLIHKPVMRYADETALANRRDVELSPHKADRRRQTVLKEGFIYARQTDFSEYLNSVPLNQLRQRIELFWTEDAFVNVIINWLRRGVPLTSGLWSTLALLMPDIICETVKNQDLRLIRDRKAFWICYRQQNLAQKAVQCYNQIVSDLQHKVSTSYSWKAMNYPIDVEIFCDARRVHDPVKIEQLDAFPPNCSPGRKGYGKYFSRSQRR